MKKILIVFVLLLVAAVACIYVFIPRQLKVSHIEQAATNDKWTFSFLMNASEWRKWWPSDNSTVRGSADTLFHYNKLSFKPDSLFFNALNINIEADGNAIVSKMYLVPVGFNKVQMEWQCELDGGNNPFTRWMQYKRAVAIKNGMAGILSSYKKWLEVPEYLYGFDVKPGKIIDTLLVAAIASFKSYPTPEQVDTVFQVLRKYIEKNNAEVSGYPMLHVVINEAGVYEAQMALPINKVIPETDAISIKSMFAGNALITKIKGGNYTIAKAFEACEYYKADHDRSSPAIPFQSMITNRVTETDTAKWETIIYCPVY